MSFKWDNICGIKILIYILFSLWYRNQQEWDCNCSISLLSSSLPLLPPPSLSSSPFLFLSKVAWIKSLYFCGEGEMGYKDNFLLWCWGSGHTTPNMAPRHNAYFKLKELEKMVGHAELSPTLLLWNRSKNPHVRGALPVPGGKAHLISEDKGIPRKNLDKQALSSFPQLPHSPS